MGNGLKISGQSAMIKVGETCHDCCLRSAMIELFKSVDLYSDNGLRMAGFE